jgi:phage replication-related protein YjqB (UPF0714/DUF867 family)
MSPCAAPSEPDALPKREDLKMDEYSSYSELADSEKEGEDFERFVCARDGATVAIIAPHAGRIEPKTGDIAQNIAGTEFSFYCFRGLKKIGNHVLHITSHHFDEPKCLALVTNHRWIVAIHGCDEQGERVFLSGLDRALINDLTLALSYLGIVVETTGQRYPATGAKNICNMGITKKGVQFELSLSFRNGERVRAFVKAVREVLLKRQSGA